MHTEMQKVKARSCMTQWELKRQRPVRVGRELNQWIKRSLARDSSKSVQNRDPGSTWPGQKGPIRYLRYHHCYESGTRVCPCGLVFLGRSGRAVGGGRLSSGQARWIFLVLMDEKP